MSLACAFAAALNPAKKEEIFIWYLKDGCAQVDRKAVHDFLDKPTSSARASRHADTDDALVAATAADPVNYEAFSSCVNFSCAAQATAVPANPDGSEPQIANSQSDLAAVAYPTKNCMLIYYLTKDSEQDYDYFT